MNRRNYKMNLYDIIGPVMVGPSSSHTAGAVKIGYVSRNLCQLLNMGRYRRIHTSIRQITHSHTYGGWLQASITVLGLPNSATKDAKYHASIRTQQLSQPIILALCMLFCCSILLALS